MGNKRAHNFVDLTGQRFGLLTALALASTSGKTRWLCRCDCGTESVKVAAHMHLGLTKSCGCLRRKTAADSMRATSTRHGLCAGGTPRWYSIWRGMMDRCYNQNFHRYHRYGGRGITVCERWHDAENFLADMGAPPAGLTIERDDNDAGYSQGNCRWATKQEQNNNRSTTRRITFGGETMSLAAWAERVGVTKSTMGARLKTWPLERALTEPANR